ncbi:MAG: hypothetical protein QM820_05990 [Minicystis sp.]
MVHTKILGMTAGTLLAALTVSPAFARGHVRNSSPQATNAGRAPEGLRLSPQTRLHSRAVSGTGDPSRPGDESEGMPGYRTADPEGGRPSDEGEGIPGYRTADPEGGRPSDEGEGIPGY